MSKKNEQEHFFEGPEKKLEIIFKSEMGFLDFQKSFWDDLVSLASAKILSSIESKSCKAFLLSESSLFVWDSRITLITCGTTELIKAAEFLIAEFGKDSISEIFFERKNEYYPALQKSSAFEDMKCLKEQLDGVSVRYGRQDDHHVYVYNKFFTESSVGSKIRTLELLMYGLKGEFNDAFYSKNNKQNLVVEKLKEIFPGFELDTFFFEPEGFSFNALKGEQYATIHVTPQGSENYLSLEVDRVTVDEGKRIVEEMVRLLKPVSFDTVLFSPDKHEDFDVFENIYSTKQICKSETESGYKIVYKHFFNKELIKLEPLIL